MPFLVLFIILGDINTYILFLFKLEKNVHPQDLALSLKTPSTLTKIFVSKQRLHGYLRKGTPRATSWCFFSYGCLNKIATFYSTAVLAIFLSPSRKTDATFSNQFSKLV